MNWPKLNRAWSKNSHRYRSGGFSFLLGGFMSKSYDKPFCTFDQLINVLKDKHGLTISNPEDVTNVLKFIPYYDLINGYKEIFMQDDRFKNDVNIIDLFLLHAFDHNFQSALFEQSNMIENYFKNILAYIISKSYGVDHNNYLNPTHYLPKKVVGKKHKIIRKEVLQEIRNLSTNVIDNPTYYYRTHHNHIPPWILLKNISFSLSTNLFILLLRNQKQEILDIMLPINRTWDQRLPVLLYTLTMIRKCRNIIAHNLKFTSFDASIFMNNLDKKTLRIMIPQELLTDAELKSDKYITGIYGYIILCLSIIPNNITKLLFIQRLRMAITLNGILTPNLQNIGQNIIDIYCRGIDLPANFRERIDLYSSHIMDKH